MIKEKEIELRINNNMVQFYNKILNMNLKSGQIIKINVNNLSVGSHKIITCICDKCGKEKKMIYKEYYSVMKSDSENKYYCQKCAVNKHEKTMLEKYGVKHALQVEKFKDKAKETWLENYGVDHPAKCKKIRDKFNNTMIERYGVKNALENKDILKNMYKKNLKKYGMIHVFQNEEIKNKIKETCLEKYGCENSHQNEDVKNKFIKTCNEKYGYDYYLQNPKSFFEFLKNTLKMKKYKETILYYQGTYEKDFLDLCEKLNILNFVERGCTINYTMDNKSLIYFPDFFIRKDNILIEIKSSYWYNLHKEKNIIKEKTCRELGFDYFLILDKNYDEFLNKVFIY